MSDLVLYTSDDGRTRLNLRFDGKTVWLPQLEIAEHFQTTKQNVSFNAQNIFKTNELHGCATVKKSLTVATEVIFLEQAELRAKQHKDLTLDFWRSSVDRMLASNDQPLLDGPGTVSHEGMKTIAADAENVKAIEDLEKEIKQKGRNA